MTRNQKYTLGFILLAAAYIGNEYVKHKLLKEEIIAAPVLKENEKQKIIVDTSRKEVTVVRRGPIGKGKEGKNGTQTVTKTDGARKVIVTENNDGSIQVTTINKGFCLEPGLALYYSDKPRLGLDVQVAYYKRWGALLGAGVNIGDGARTVRAHVGVNYALPFNFVENTSVFMGIDHRKDVIVGFRIKF